MNGPAVSYSFSYSAHVPSGRELAHSEAPRELTYPEAVERLRTRAGDVEVRCYPGVVTVTVQAGQGLRGDPRVMCSGWGYQEARQAERIGRALTEAARLAAEAAGSTR